MREPQARQGELTGRGIERVDARLKATGAATYAAEFSVANLAHATIVTSVIGSGRLTAIDTRSAAASPGVILVLTHENALRLPGASKHGASPTERVLQLLEDSEIHYNDQPIAVVVADTLDNAQLAASKVKATYREGPLHVELERSVEQSYMPKTTVRGPVDSARGDFERAFAKADVKISETYTTPLQNHNPMEMHATVAVWYGDARLTVYDSTQGIFGVQKRLASLFGMPAGAVRVISPYVGGGFGCKGTPWSHVALSAMAARAAGRPVKLVVTRAQMFSLVGHRPATIQHIALGADVEGKLTAIRHDVVSETSRFDEFIEPAAAQTRMLYDCPNVRTSHRLVRLDVPTPTFMRAPGESTGTYALEAAMDELSTYPAGLSAASAVAKLRSDGSALVQAGSQDIGTGTYTVMTQIAADALALPLSRVRFELGDTNFPETPVSGGSRTAASVGSAVKMASQQVLAKLKIMAVSDTGSPLHGLESKELAASDGMLFAKAHPGKHERYADILERAGKSEIAAQADAKESEERKAFSTHSFGAQFAEVRVDEDLGEVRVTRMVAAFAAGKILNARTARSQFVTADHFYVGSIENAAAACAACEQGFAMVMSHDYALDRETIGHLLSTRVRYLGVLGPRQRTARILADLERAGRALSEADRQRIYAPMGLDLGAETPREIALSVIAEIQTVRSGAAAGCLRDRRGSIHAVAASMAGDRLVAAAGDAVPGRGRWSSTDVLEAQAK